jgi:hypothetical protein
MNDHAVVRLARLQQSAVLFTVLLTLLILGTEAVEGGRGARTPSVLLGRL